MKLFLLILGLFYAIATPAQTGTAHKSAAPVPKPAPVGPTPASPPPLSNGFIRPATRAVTAIKENNLAALASAPTPTDDRINEAEAAGSNSTDKAFLAAIKKYQTQKKFFNVMRDLVRVNAELKAENGGAGVPSWSCPAFEDKDVCPSYQTAVKTLIAADRELADDQAAIEECDDALADALKTKTFESAPHCGLRSK